MHYSFWSHGRKLFRGVCLREEAHALHNEGALLSGLSDRASVAMLTVIRSVRTVLAEVKDGCGQARSTVMYTMNSDISCGRDHLRSQPRATEHGPCSDSLHMPQVAASSIAHCLAPPDLIISRDWSASMVVITTQCPSVPCLSLREQDGSSLDGGWIPAKTVAVWLSCRA